MKDFDEIIKMRMKEDHGIELSSSLLKLLRKSIDYKILKVVRNLEILHITDVLDLFPRYSKFWNVKRLRKEAKVVKKITDVDPDF